MVALALVFTTSPAFGVDHIHASSRFDRSFRSLDDQVERFTSTRASVLTYTEVSSRRGALRQPGWGSFTPPGTDLGIMWRRSVWRAVKMRVYRTTMLTYVQWNGYRVRQRVAVVLLVHRGDGRRLLVTTAHLPSDVDRRYRIWHSAVRGWGDLVRELRQRWHPGVTIVSADWNVNLRKRVWRHRIDREFPNALDLKWRRLPTGTLGKRVIDGTWSDGVGRSRVLGQDRSSDHRPYRERLFFRTWGTGHP